MNHPIPLAEFGEILGKGAVRGLVRYPAIKGEGERRIGLIQKYHKLLWTGLDRQEQAIALNISVKELTEALNHPPVVLVD